jgi:ribosomal protein S18 acetylase RimI-like enzyme
MRVRAQPELNDGLVCEVRHVIEAQGAAGLRIDDLMRSDLSSLGWSGTARHVVSVGRALERVDSGEVEYLVVRSPGGYPVAKAGIDYAAKPGVGTIMQLATLDALQGLGIGTHLIAIAEGRVRNRGLREAELRVEQDNPRARALYERLGYEEAGRRASWEVEDEDGKVGVYETELIILRKELCRASGHPTARARKDR